MTSLIDGCLEGFKEHDFSGNSEFCKRCGMEKSRIKAVKRAPGRPPGSTNRPKVESALTKREAQEGISMMLLAAQTVIITARPEFKEDALSAKERELLADALTDEAMGSVTIKRWLTKVGQQQKHTKLFMVLIAIMMPRLMRRGIIPVDQETSEQLIAEAAKTPGFSGDTANGSEIDFESVPVAAGGSPITNRGNGFGENNISGVVAETAPLRSGVENENGRREVSNGRGGEIPSVHVESETEPNRVEAGSSTRRPKKS